MSENNAIRKKIVIVGDGACGKVLKGTVAGFSPLKV
jgi:hypothetical protein